MPQSVMTTPVVEKLLAKAKDALSAKTESNRVKITSLFQMEADFVQADGLKRVEMDVVAGRVAGYDEMFAEVGMSEADRLGVADYKAQKEKFEALSKARDEAAAKFRADAQKLQTEINESDLPEQRRLAGKVELYEEMLAAMKGENVDHPTVMPAA